ncbi:MAG: hypothetical protein VW127_03000 [Flavobacteriaceae bacterium]|jgi:hypothetical protein
MIKTILVQRGYTLSVILEVMLLLFFYVIEGDIGEVFRLAARYSGRLSLGIYLLCFYLFVEVQQKDEPSTNIKKALGVFAVMHLIHFIYLSVSLHINQVPIVPTRLAGGFIAYLMIVLYPFLIEKITRKVYHLIYFYYVGFVMMMTYISRVRGQFEGASPEIFHYVALIVLLTAFLFFGIRLSSKK